MSDPNWLNRTMWTGDDLMTFKIVLALLIVLALAACSADVWTGFVYPDRTNLLVDIPIGGYPSLLECRDAALDLIEARRWDNADYECGLNCRPGPSFELLVCEVTRR